MKRIGIIFPDDLAVNNKTLQQLNDEDTLLIYEPCDTFYQINHHKQKIAFLISAGLVQSLKHFVFENHMRPMYVFQNVKGFHQIKDFHYHMSQSFPSGHSTSSFVLFTFIAMNFAKTGQAQILCFIGALFFAFTRVYLSQHYFEDLFAGAMIGFLCMKYTQVFLQSKWTNLDEPLNK